MFSVEFQLKIIKMVREEVFHLFSKFTKWKGIYFFDRINVRISPKEPTEIKLNNLRTVALWKVNNFTTAVLWKVNNLTIVVFWKVSGLQK